MAIGALMPLIRYVVMKDGAVAPGAKAYFKLSGTSTPQPVYSDSALTVPRSQPVVADAAGMLPIIYFAPVSYRVEITDANGATIIPETDNIYDFGELQLASSGGAALVGYIQSGSGAVAYTVQSRLRQKVSVADFGAVGDGVTNDLAAFQNAVTRAGAGGTVFVPALTNGKFYNLGDGLVITSKPNIRIEGESVGAVIAATTASSSAYALSLYGCSGAVVKNLSFAGVAGGGGAIRIGKSDGTAPSFFCELSDLTVPVNFDQDAIVGYHCMSTQINRVVATADATRPSTDAALNGGVYGPNSATITASCINFVLQASGQSNALSVNQVSISGWRGFGLIAEGVDELIIQGGDITGNARNHALLTNPAQIKLTDCSRIGIQNCYTETLAAGSARNLYADTCKDLIVDGVIYGADTSAAGYIELVGCERPTLRNCFGEGIAIDATTADARLDGVSYAGNGGTFTDLGKRSQRSRLVKINASNNMAAGQTMQQQMNLLTNPGFEQWTSTSAVVGWTSSNCTVARSGTGESDTTKFRGQYAVKLSTRTNATNGLIFEIADYADSTLRTAMIGQKITVSFWCKVTAGTGVTISAYYDGSTTDDSTTFAPSDWTKISQTFVIRSGFSLLQIRIVLQSDTTVAFLDEGAVFYGEAASASISDRTTELGRFGQTVVTSSATPTFYHQGGYQVYAITLTANITGITFSTTQPGPVMIRFIQNSGGGFTVTGWPANVKREGNADPTIAAAANAITSVSFYSDGTNLWQSGPPVEYQ